MSELEITRNTLKSWSLLVASHAGHVDGQGSKLQRWHSVKSPSHSNPPNWGTGLSHLLDLVWSPPPHSAVHGPHSSQSLNPPSIGQGFSLHGSVSEASPVQSAPPCSGAGLSHTRVLLCSDPPQET